MSLLFRDRQRLAVLHILGETPLGDTIARCAPTSAVIDDGELVTVEIADHDYDHVLSTGEQVLADVLWSLHGTQEVLCLADIAPAPGAPAPIDADSQWAVVYALGIAVGKFEPIRPAVNA